MKSFIKVNCSLAISLLIFISLVSCSKDGDAPSTDMSKVYGQWLATEIYSNGVNIISEYQTSNVGIIEVSDMHKELYNAQGAFAAVLGYTTDSNPNGTIYLQGYCKLVSSNVMRVTQELDMHSYDLKIKKSTSSELIFEFEDDELGWLEIRCKPLR
ncbi:hypothetical protein H8S95_00995 [Pontibacter sp. KCTC 32443]|nr:hypothetical protein [Pontibacter sp. KCTC 32443]